MNNYTLTRRQAREAALIFFYQYLLNENDEKDLNKFVKDTLMNLNLILEEKYKSKKDISVIDDELFLVILKDLNNISKYKDELDQYLDENWKFDRLSYTDQSILLLSLIQIKAGIAKTIVINEAVELAKQYCDDDNFKFINGVLDKVNE